MKELVPKYIIPGFNILHFGLSLPFHEPFSSDPCTFLSPSSLPSFLPFCSLFRPYFFFPSFALLPEQRPGVLLARDC